MPVQAAIVINDGLATPVAHTFAPTGSRALPDGKIRSEWVDRSIVQKVGQYWIRIEQSPPNGAGVEKYRIVIDRPTMQTLSNGSVSGIEPVPGKAMDTVFDGEFRLPVAAGAAELDDIYAFTKNLMATTFIGDLIKNRDSVW
jgi:hypothetical protein